MTRDIITDVSAEIRITLPDGDVLTASTGAAPGHETSDQQAVPALPEPDPEQVRGGDGGPSGGRPGADGGGGGEDALADLPPELLIVESLDGTGSADLPPPSVAHIEAMVAAVDATSDILPPEVVALEALIETDSASLEPPDVSELLPPKRTTRKRN